MGRLKTQHCHVQQSLSGDFQNVSEQLTVTLLPCGSLYLLVGGGKEDRDREGVEEGKNTGLGLGQAHTERCSKHLGFCSEIQTLTHS